MTIGTTIDTALTAVLENSWPVTLPPETPFPAIEYEIESEPEQGWVLDQSLPIENRKFPVQHLVTVIIYAYKKSEITSYAASIRLAMEGISQFMGLEEFGDMPYEEASGVYSYFMNFRIRTTTLGEIA